MNLLRRLVVTFFCLTPALYAAGEPLNVGITSFTPPFVMQGANHEIYGFDIDMMNTLCKTINRTCQFHIMRFDQLISSVANKTIDVAVSSITITSARAKIVNFSLPYLLSYSRFLAKPASVTQSFSLDLLNGKTIGVVTGTIFSDQIKEMGIKNPNIKEFARIEELLEGLSSGKVDFILLDSPTTLYWEANSAGAFVKVGPPYLYGYGLGIATNPSLLPILNQALLQYQNSNDFKLNYNRYLTQF